MGKNMIVLAAVAVLIVAALFGGYAIGIHRATTAEGWMDEDHEGAPRFMLEIDGNIYIWDISEEEYGR